VIDDPKSVFSFITLLKDVGAYGSLVLVLYGLVRGTFILKKHHEDVVARMEAHQKGIVERWQSYCEELHLDRNAWRDRAWELDRKVDRAVSVADKVTPQRGSER
jgi:hypothetical protein